GHSLGSNSTLLSPLQKSCNWLYLQDVIGPGNFEYYSTIWRGNGAGLTELTLGSCNVLRLAPFVSGSALLIRSRGRRELEADAAVVVLFAGRVEIEIGD